MIILGGEPPFVDTPEPRFGEVIKKMNAFVEAIHVATDNFNNNNADKLETIKEDVQEFVDTVAIPVDTHLAARGPQHGETKASVGLEKKDNFRTATLAEQIAFAPVQAFVTPQGAKAALAASNGSFKLSDYQNNDMFQFASFFYPDYYPVVTPTVNDPVRYFGPSKKTGLLLNGDKLVFSPLSDSVRYTYQSIFTSMPTGISKGTRLGEITNLNASYLTASWNTVGCDTTDGLTAFFKPLADKKIYQYKNNLAMAGTNKNYLLYSMSTNAAYKGIAVSSSFVGTAITLYHKFFSTANPGTDPALGDQVAGSYLGLFDRFDTPQYSGPANGSQTFDLKDYVDLPPQATIDISGGSHGIVTTLLWNIPNGEAYLHVAVPCTARLAGKTQKLVFGFILSIVPGTLSPGGSAVFRQLGTRAKDTLGANLLPAGQSNWFKDGNLFDFFNLTQYPGVMLNSGELVKAASTKLGTRVKRFGTDYAGMKDFLLAERPVIDARLASTEMYAPMRHACFGLIPERIIPYSQDSINALYLVYGADEITGRFGWRDYSWATASIVSTQSGDGTFGIALPGSTKAVETISDVPPGLSIYVNKAGLGVAVSALAFNEANGYVGKASFQYLNGTLTVGADVSLAIPSLIAIRAASGSVMLRAAAANPLVNAALRTPSIQVFKLNATKVIVLISDGLNYAEVGVADYTVTGSKCTLTFQTTNGLKLYPATNGGQPAIAGNRYSQSGDDPWMNYSDMLAVMVDANTYNIVFPRAFGNIYGDVSCSIAGVNGATQTVTKGKVNYARLYQGVDAFDTVEEVYPALLIPNKGVYQYEPTNSRAATLMNEVGGTTKVDPYNINESGWVRLPAGARFVVNGRTVILDRDYSVKVATSGVTYCYLRRSGTNLSTIASSIQREPVNNEVLFGISTNGVLALQKSYIVMDSRSISATRHGSAIPCFIDDGGQGVNQFFTRRDVKS
jgi:hypothetical protein